MLDGVCNPVRNVLELQLRGVTSFRSTLRTGIS
jgi:hypothetical protein